MIRTQEESQDFEFTPVEQEKVLKDLDKLDGILHSNNSLRESFDNRTRSSSTCKLKRHVEVPK